MTNHAPPGSDRDLVDRILDGDAEAASTLVARLSRFVWMILTVDRGLRAEEAEEVYADVFVRLWKDDCRRLRRWSGDAPLSAYVRTIVRDMASDFIAKKVRTRERETPLASAFDDRPGRERSEDPDPELQAVLTERQSVLRAGLRRLPDSYRKVVQMRYFEGLSYHEIGAAMGGWTPSRVGVTLFRARQKLHDWIREEHSDLLEPPAPSVDAGAKDHRPIRKSP